MKTAYRLITLCGVSLIFVCFFPFPIELRLLQGWLFLICILGLLFALIATLIIGLASWRKLSRWWMGPPLLCIAFIVSFVICARIGVSIAVDDWWFQKHMVPYVMIVDSVKSGTIPCGPTIANIHSITNLPPGIRNIDAARCTDGSVLVLFVAKGSSFAGDFGYLYKDYSETNSCIADNIKPDQIGRLDHITGNWYEFWN
jgi:amino acid transporter